jgi:hypothetical protein
MKLNDLSENLSFKWIYKFRFPSWNCYLHKNNHIMGAYYYFRVSKRDGGWEWMDAQGPLKRDNIWRSGT